MKPILKLQTILSIFLSVSILQPAMAWQDFEQEPIQDPAVQQADFESFPQSISDAITGDDIPTESMSSGGLLGSLTSSLPQINVTKMLGSLAIVLSGYFALVWLVRRTNPGANMAVPQEVVEVLGAVPFGPRKNLQVVRLGSKLLLVVNSHDVTQPIGEITDPHEVEYLASLCSGKSTARSAIAVRKASTANQIPNSNVVTTGNLKQILQQLQQGTNQDGAVFEA